MKETVRKANEFGIPEDSILVRDATWALNFKKKQID